MKKIFFLALGISIAIQAEYVAEVKVTKVTDVDHEVVMDTTLVVNSGQSTAITVEGDKATALELCIDRE